MTITKKLYLLGILPLFLLMLSTFAVGLFVKKANNATTKFIEQYQVRHEKLYEIYTEIGYVGAIHDFKNYVLRFEDKYKEDAVQKINKARKLISEYFQYTPLSDVELNALTILDSTLANYFSKISIAEKLIASGASQSEIDDSVKVNDTSALVALNKLREFLSYERTKVQSNLKESHENATLLFSIIFSMAIILALYLVVLISSDFLKSFKILKNLSSRLANGKLKNDYNYIADLKNEEFIGLGNVLIELGQKLDHAFDELEKTNENLANFAHVASHDIQEPIKKVSVYADLIKNDLAENNINSKSNEYIEVIKNSSVKMIALVRALLLYSKSSNNSVVFEDIDLNTVLNSTKKSLEISIKEGQAKIESDDLPTVKGSMELISSLFQNLISNSIKYRRPHLPPKISITAIKSSEKYWKITFSDNGIGFDMSHIKTVLRPFGRAHSSDEYSGVGIGLSLCKQIIESHGSTFNIHSEENVGTTITFNLIDSKYLSK